jgi:hypothetical protein
LLQNQYNPQLARINTKEDAYGLHGSVDDFKNRAQPN